MAFNVEALAVGLAIANIQPNNLQNLNWNTMDENLMSSQTNANAPVGCCTRIVVGCNYHTTWQRHKSMRFVLAEVKGNKARLQTRNTGKDFWTDVKDLIFIESDYNKRKAANIESSLSDMIVPDWVNNV